MDAPAKANHRGLQAALHTLDWAAPWWQPWRAVGQRVAEQVLHGNSVAQALNETAQTLGHTAQAGNQLAQQLCRPFPTPAADPRSVAAASPTSPLPQFVPQSALPDGAAYEAFIFRTGLVPTRENLHDFFNGLVWLQFPQTKRQLNALQNAAIQSDGIQSQRGALRDALTLFDENAALWCPTPCAPPIATSITSTTTTIAAPTPVSAPADPALLHALRNKQWQRAFVELRADWPAGQPLLLGHALLEKLVTPYKSITAHVFVVSPVAHASALATGHAATPAAISTRTAAPSNGLQFVLLDAQLAAQLCPAALVPKPFFALPVLGVPGWWPANIDPAFYADRAVFRPPQ